MVQWLRLCLSMQGIQVQSLVRKLKSYVLCRRKQNKTKHKKKQQYCNKFNEDLKKKKNSPHQNKKMVMILEAVIIIYISGVGFAANRFQIPGFVNKAMHMSS